MSFTILSPEAQAMCDYIVSALAEKLLTSNERQISKNEAVKRYRCRTRIEKLINEDKIATKKIGRKLMLSVQDLEREIGTQRMKAAIKNLNKNALKVRL